MKTISVWLIIIFLMLFSNICFASSNEKTTLECVPNKEVAVTIANVICNAVYPNLKLDNYKVQVSYYEPDESWIIAYLNVPVLETIEQNSDVLAKIESETGGGPVLIIRKSDAQVTLIMLQK